MTYDRRLGQYLEHEHDEYALEEHTHGLREVAGANEALANQGEKLKTHISSTGNPHKVTAEQVGKDRAQWNADRVNGVVVDNEHLRHGWSLAYNSKSKKLEYFPLGDERFFDHDKLKNYKEAEHAPLDDEAISKKRVWSSAKTSKAMAENLNLALERVKNLQKQLEHFDEGAGLFVISGGTFERPTKVELNFGDF